jgi:hypothetical protein
VEFCKANAPEVDLFNTYILLSYLYLKADKLEWSTYYTDLAIDITTKKKILLAKVMPVSTGRIFMSKKSGLIGRTGSNPHQAHYCQKRFHQFNGRPSGRFR